MKKILLMLSAVLFFGCSAPQPQNNGVKNKAWEMALALDIEGKGGYKTCWLFAKDLHNRYVKAGIESYVVIYDWEKKNAIGVIENGRHDIVVYKDEKGRYWGMDSQRNAPQWLKGTTAEEWLVLYENDAIKTTVVSVLTGHLE